MREVRPLQDGIAFGMLGGDAMLPAVRTSLPLSVDRRLEGRPQMREAFFHFVRDDNLRLSLCWWLAEVSDCCCGWWWDGQ